MFNALQRYGDETRTIASDIGGGYALTKVGSGTLTLTGNNYYTGSTKVNGGTIKLGHVKALGDISNSLTLTTGVTVDLAGVSPTIGALSGSGGTITNSTATPVSLAFGSGGATDSFAGVIQNGSGVMSLVKIGAGTQTLSGANTFTGGANITEGKLVVTSASGLGPENTGVTTVTNATLSITHSGYASSQNRRHITVNAGGVLSNDAPNNSFIFYNGKLILNGGEITTTNSPSSYGSWLFANFYDYPIDVTADSKWSAIQWNDNNTGGRFRFNFTNGAILTMTGTLGANAYGLGQMQLIGSGTLYLASSVLRWTTGNILTIGVGTTAIFANGLTSPLGSGLVGAGTITNNGTLTIDRTVAFTSSNIISGTGVVNHKGAGVTTLSGINTYTGVTTVNAGTLIIAGNGGGSGYTGGIRVKSGATLKLASSLNDNAYYTTTITVDGDGTAATTGLYVEGGKSWLIGLVLAVAPTVIRRSGTGIGIFRGFDYNSTHIVCPAVCSGSYSDANINILTGTHGIVFNVSSGASNATGDFTINGPLSGNGRIGNKGSGSLAITGTNPAATLTVLWAANSGSSIIVTGQLGGGVNGGGHILTWGNSKLIWASTLNQTLSGAISGAGALIKSSSGTLTLTGNSSYTGGTTINGGTITCGHINAFGTGTITVNAGGTLNLNGLAITNTIVNNGGTVI